MKNTGYFVTILSSITTAILVYIAMGIEAIAQHRQNPYFMFTLLFFVVVVCGHGVFLLVNTNNKKKKKNNMDDLIQ